MLIYRFDADKGSLVANDPPFAAVQPGAGPRHFAFHPSGRFAYVINEIDVTLTVFSRDPERGGLTAVQTLSTLPVGQAVEPGFSTADVQSILPENSSTGPTAGTTASSCSRSIRRPDG